MEPLYKMDRTNGRAQNRISARRPRPREEDRWHSLQFAVSLSAVMWSALALAVCVMACGAPALESPAYGVKLCGREFIRAVIFTCGGSRWRRSLRSTDLLQDSLDPVDDDQSSDRWLADADLLPSSPLVQAGGAAGAEPGEEVARDWWRHQGGVFSRSARSLITNEILEALRTSDRKGRDVVVGLSNACCKWGCSKSEISSLC